MTRAFSVYEAAREPHGGVVFDGALVTWRELASGARRCARALVGRGASTLAVRATARPETVSAILGIIAAGAPLALVHPRATAKEAARLTESAGAGGPLVDDELLRDALGEAGEAPPPAALAREAQLILFTSGSTGREKAVVLPESALAASARASEAIFGWQPDDRWLLAMPLSHVGGLSVLLRCLRARSTVVLHPRFDPDAVLASIEADRVTIASLVPAMLHALLERDARAVLPRLRAVLLGGAHASRALLEECAARGISVHTTYGLTEASSQVTTQRRRPRGVVEAGSGEPVPGVTVTIHGQGGGALPMGHEGRIRVSGPTLMRGYLGAEPIGGVFDTDDLGVLDERGRLFVLGRRSDRIVTGGENVDPLEVEAALEACPGVLRAVVFGVDDERWGQLVAAAVEVVGEPALVERELLAELEASLASYKRPRRIAFASELPRALGGVKLDRARCRRELTPLLRPFG